jgi:hypothetical protein
VATSASGSAPWRLSRRRAPNHHWSKLHELFVIRPNRQVIYPADGYAAQCDAGKRRHALLFDPIKMQLTGNHKETTTKPSHQTGRGGGGSHHKDKQ